MSALQYCQSACTTTELILRNIMPKSKSSKRWLNEHFDDHYVQLARKEGYRSRAIYKLQELDNKYHLFHPGQVIVDLGAAPGSWSQYAMLKVGDHGRVIASDLLLMDSIAGVDFIQGDFREETVLQAILAAIQSDPTAITNSDKKRQADLVISDMAPNMSGVDAVDIPRAMYLLELSQDLADRVLKPKGGFVGKLFQGQGTDQWLADQRKRYQKLVVKKPKASRPRSREVYVIATGFKG